MHKNIKRFSSFSNIYPSGITIKITFRENELHKLSTPYSNKVIFLNKTKGVGSLTP